VAVFIVLLRAINVGGTGKIAMNDLRALCESCGCSNVRTYIQSGNVVLESSLAEEKLSAKLARALEAKMGKPVGVLVRTAAELGRALKKNPFKKAEPNRVAVYFLDEPPLKRVLKEIVIPGREAIELAGREVFVHYPDGQGQSKLKLPFAKTGTARNINTVTKLLEMAEEPGDHRAGSRTSSR
jgi:uncharacterized protein (DUF1697 family)